MIGGYVRLFHYVIAVTFVFALSTPARASGLPSFADQTSIAWQVSDILGAVKSAFRGKKRRRRSGRYRGRNTPILATPPEIPARRPDASGVFSDQAIKPVLQDVTRAAVQSEDSGTEARTAIVASALPTEQSDVSLPARRPAKTERVVKTSVSEPETISDVVPPAPAFWQPDEISAAYDACDAMLGRKIVEIEPVDPIRNGACGMPGPVKLRALGDLQSVRVKPAATLNCKTVLGIHKWLEEKVQPTAKRILKSPVVRIRNVSSYSCRNRNNAKSGRLSEHALGNALDIASFVLADGRTISVLSDWGTVERDLVGAATAQPTAVKPIRTRVASRTPVVPQEVSFDARVPLPVFKGPVRRGVRLNRASNTGDLPAWTALGASDVDQDTTEPDRPVPVPAKARFLKQIHADACGIFGTVLGPEANDAHRDHFHLDMAERRYKSYCR